MLRKLLNTDLLDIQKKSDEATAMVKELDATSAAAITEQVTQTVAKIRANPDASLVDKAIADAVCLQHARQTRCCNGEMECNYPNCGR